MCMHCYSWRVCYYSAHTVTAHNTYVRTCTRVFYNGINLCSDPSRGGGQCERGQATTGGN